MADGNRMLGDGKTWNGLIGGSLTSGLLCMLLANVVTNGDLATVFDDGATVFAHPLTGADEAWFYVGGANGAAFVLGTFLGFACLVGDSTGSFFKRRRGLKGEGDISSKAPLLDTLLRHHGVLVGPTFPRPVGSRSGRIAHAHGGPHSHHPHPPPIVQPHRLQDRLERRPVLTEQCGTKAKPYEAPSDRLNHAEQHPCIPSSLPPRVVDARRCCRVVLVKPKNLRR